MKEIVINYDFSTGNELPYCQSKKAIKNGENFETNCISIFSFDRLFYNGYDDVVVKESTGKYISAKELLENTGEYTDREIRRAHNLQKLFCAGAINWKTI